MANVCILVSTLKSIIRHNHGNSTLKINTSECDQGTANIGTIKILKTETIESYTRACTEYRKQGFQADGQEIVTIFDLVTPSFERFSKQHVK